MDPHPQELLDQGFVILRGVVPGGELPNMRESCERLLERQKEIWRRERQPGDPPGGEWELARQPRVSIDKVVDESTAHVVDFCLGEATMGASRRLMGAPVASPGMLAMLCSPPIGMGRTRWHRDITPPSLAPLCGLQQDMLANGPALVQWNVALYDDDVLWVVPGSHRRPNTEAENAQWRFDAWAPMPGSIPVELEAGDGVAYSNMILHWGSNYTARLRRTLHLGYRCFGSRTFPYYAGHGWDLEFADRLSPESRRQFEFFEECCAAECDLICGIFRAMIDRNARAFRGGLARLHPGEQGRMVALTLLSKAARALPVFHDPGVSENERRASAGAFYVNLMEPIRARFTADEAGQLWQRFKTLDAKLQADCDQFEPMMHVTSTRYRFYDMPENFEVDDFIASWG